MDWAVGVACCQEGAGDQAGPATGQCWAVPPPPGLAIFSGLELGDLTPLVSVRPTPYPPLPTWEGKFSSPMVWGQGWAPLGHPGPSTGFPPSAWLITLA